MSEIVPARAYTQFRRIMTTNYDELFIPMYLLILIELTIDEMERNNDECDGWVLKNS